MRLSPEQQNRIGSLVMEHLGKQASVSLFGSRLDDQKRGGDIDLIVHSVQRVPLMKKAALKLALESALGLPVDMIFIHANRPPTTFQALAKSQSQPLGHQTP